MKVSLNFKKICSFKRFHELGNSQNAVIFESNKTQFRKYTSIFFGLPRKRKGGWLVLIKFHLISNSFDLIQT